MSHSFPIRQARNGKHTATTPTKGSPLRQASTVSSSSSENDLNHFTPSRTSTVSSSISQDYFSTTVGHKRGISQSSPTKTSKTFDLTFLSNQTSPTRSSQSERQSLRALPQAPNVVLNPVEKAPRYRDPRGANATTTMYTMPGSEEDNYGKFGMGETGSIARSDRTKSGTPSAPVTRRATVVSLSNHYGQTSPPSTEPQLQRTHSIALSRSNSRHDPTHKRSSRLLSQDSLKPHANILESSDLQKLGKSSTSHFRELSKYAEDGAVEALEIKTPEQEVTGLHGRRRLQRDISVRGKRQLTAPGYGGKTWMDQQRQFLQAYEYLCHIGEAKEWIEDIIHKEIPPIVQLEEALRDGVTLAEIVQTLRPDKQLRIFRHHKLQFRHSDNIAHFFRFLSELELPELFRFELVDLYEKKNIPKVIYCIHALSWLLFRKGVVGFRIGNLVGQLEFAHDELEAMQKGLDKAGVSMPNFSGMGERLGAVAEPVPVETEEERMHRNLMENEHFILDLQAQTRGMIARLRLGDIMHRLWNFEDWLVDLQSRIRGDFARTIFNYRLEMRHFAVSLQSLTRAFLVRKQHMSQHAAWKHNERLVIVLQSLIRARQARKTLQVTHSTVQRHVACLQHLQAAIRGAMKRVEIVNQLEETELADAAVTDLQGQIRGALYRIRQMKHQAVIRKAEVNIGQLQAAIRGAHLRFRVDKQNAETRDVTPHVESLQAAARGMLRRRKLLQEIASLGRHEQLTSVLQSVMRGFIKRCECHNTVQALKSIEPVCTNLQSVARTRILTLRLQGTHTQLKTNIASITRLQAAVRGMKERRRVVNIRVELSRYSEHLVQLASVIRGVALRGSLVVDLEALRTEQKQILFLQGCIRGFLLRQKVYDMLTDLNNHHPAICELQSLARAMLHRLELGDILEKLEVEDETMTELEALVRGFLVRRSHSDKQKYFNENMKKVIKVQSFIRARQQGEAYKSLTSGKNPPVSTVKSFVHLLNDSDFDFDEELESEKLRKLIVQRVQANEQTEEYIMELDAKIGMLAKTKITSDDTAKHHASFTNRNTVARDTLNLKALSKSSRAKLELYQELFFILQTQPQYLSRLFKKVRENGAANEEYKYLEALVMRMFLFAQNNREEFLLLKLMSKSIKQEVDGCATLKDFLRAKFFYARLFSSYTRIPRDRKFIPEALGPMIRANITDNETLDLESDPLIIYRAILNDDELRTGQRSQRSPDVPREQAIKDPLVREAFIRHLQDLRDVCDAFWECLEKVILPKMPYGTRYVAREMFQLLCARYPREDQSHMLQIVGSWLWRTYLKPAVTEPESFGIVTSGLDPIQKRNIAAFAKVIDQATAGQLFGADNMWMQPLNNYVEETIGFLDTTWRKLIQVTDPEVHFDIDQFNDLYAKQKPTLFISVADIFSMHQLVASNIAAICTTHDDNILRDVIRELGSAKNNEMEMSAGSADVTLSLSTKLHVVEDPDADMKARFMETKRYVLYIIRIQAGANLMDIMVKPITMEDEIRWDALVHEELAVGSRKRGAYSDANNLIDISALSYAELKRTALENILVLEEHGRLTRHNQYQDILNEIAVDIRQKHRRRVQRQKELESIRSTIAHLEEKHQHLEDVLKTFNDTYEQNLTVLQSKDRKQKSIFQKNPFGKQANHERELARLGKRPRYGSYKYSAEDLAERGILIEWKDRNLRESDITIFSDEINKYGIEGSSGSLMIPGASAEFTWDDLTDASWVDKDVVKFFGGMLVLDVKGLMQQVSKKFFAKG